MPLVGITPTPAPLVFKKGAQQQTLKWKDDVVAWTKHVAPSASIENSELVFVGYGVVAPEFNWDDYKGADLKGKTLVMLVNDPPVPDPSNASELDAKTFGGNAMTYYGRWTYKYEIGAQKGAAGVLIVHETGPAGYGFNVIQGKTGEQFDLVTPDKNMGRVAVEGWITLDQTKALLKSAGQDFDALKAQAATREFTYKDFQPQGAAAFQAGVASYFTIWSPPSGHQPRPEDRRPRDRDREHLRRPAAGGVRRLHGLRAAPRRDRHSVLHLQEGGLGLRDQPGWAQPCH